MGFYGNISNINKTNMTFDKIYSNRKSMDESCALDGVYIGRYVLVEYQQYYPLDALDNYPIIYKVGENSFSDKYNVQNPNSNWVDGQVYRCISLDGWSNSEPDLQYYIYSFYKWSKSEGKMIEITSEQDEGNYINNFNIDKDEYHSGRGYDSTVWMKQYDNSGNPRYVNIAELNSVVPTFDISVDAPSEIPQFPHFDEDSTNIYYNLHVQPSWGFRIGERPSNKFSDTDVKTTHYYIDSNGEKKDKIVKADIYFNKAGFDRNNKNSKVDLDDVGNDFISVSPTGVSGTLYNNHEQGSKTTAEDIQEMSINLPSIGNMMSEAWDIIRGPQRNEAINLTWKKEEDGTEIFEGSLAGVLKSFAGIAEDTIPYMQSNEDETKKIVGVSLSEIKLTNYELNDSRGKIIAADNIQTAFNRIENNFLDLKTDFDELNLKNGKAKGSLCHVNSLLPIGIGAIALGESVTASGQYSFAEGYNTIASNQFAHVEGASTVASGQSSHAEGQYTTASGLSSHAEGYQTIAQGGNSHAEGFSCCAIESSAHAEGDNTVAFGVASHAEGYNSFMGNIVLNISNLGTDTDEGWRYSYVSISSGVQAGDYIGIHPKYYNDEPRSFVKILKIDTVNLYIYVDLELDVTDVKTSYIVSRYGAFGDYSHTEGIDSTASGNYSHAEGSNSTASGLISHAEGDRSIASGAVSHAENGSTASGDYSHAENGSTASGSFAHSEGSATVASGNYSHVEGYHTKASSNYQHVQGKYNIEDAAEKYAHIVGNGTASNARSNAHTLDWSGNAWFAGDVYIGRTDQGAPTTSINALLQEINNLKAEIAALKVTEQ